jgi:hypothetical protein
MKKSYGFVILAIAAVLFTLNSQAMAFQVDGNVDNPGKYTTSGSLWVVLEGSGNFGDNASYPYQYPCYADTTLPCISLPQPPYAENSINHNTVDSNYVLVTGKGGSSALFAVGELNPKFAPASYVATLSCNKKGVCDLAGDGRKVEGVSSIEVVQAVPSIHVNGSSTPFTHFYSSALIVSGEGATTKSYILSQLQAMTQITFDASSSSSNTQGIWTGPTLLSILKASGADTKDMNSYVVIQATDGYAAVVSMYEATHSTGGQYALLAVEDSLNHTINNGGSSDNGLARLVLPNDNVAGRWVSNVAQIVVYKPKK